MNKLTNVWQSLSGRKRFLGYAAAFVYGGLVAVGAVQYNDAVAAVIAGWLGVAYTHAAVKGQ